MDVQVTLDGFVSNNNGKPVDFDGQYGPQCMDLINFWAKALGKRLFSGNAVNVPGQNHDQWQWKTGIPTPGSIVCFGANFKDSNIQTGPYGHVDVCLTGASGTFQGFDQNWNGVQKCEKVSHVYDDALGFLEPIESTPASQAYTDEAIREANVRMAPSINAQITSVLQAGNTFTATGTVVGDEVTQNGVTSNLWEHSKLGHFVWGGNCKRVS